MRNEKIELIRTLDFLQVMAFGLEISFEEISETYLIISHDTKDIVARVDNQTIRGGKYQYEQLEYENQKLLNVLFIPLSLAKTRKTEQDKVGFLSVIR